MRTTFRLLVPLLAALGGLRAAAAAEPRTVADLAFLAGTWRGTDGSGTVAEEIVSAPEGGVIVSAGREFKGGKCVFYDLVVFAEKDGAVWLTPHPAGRRSPRSFVLATLDPDARRATFENREHDFPQVFTYELVAPDRLRITLAGDREGRPATRILDLRRVP